LINSELEKILLRKEIRTDRTADKLTDRIRRIEPWTLNWSGSHLLRSRLSIFIILSGFLFHALHLQAQDYNYRNFGLSEGLAQPYVYTITQDSRGMLWAGTGDGLSSFNGFVFNSYTTSDSLSDNYITSSFRDSHDIFFGHRNGEVSRFDGKVFHHKGAATSELSPVTHFALSPGNKLWISTLNNGLFILNRKTLAMEGPFFDTLETISSFEFITDSDLLVASGSDLIEVKSAPSGENFKLVMIKSLGDSRVVSIKKKRNGDGFFIATQDDGIFGLAIRDDVPVLSKIATIPAFQFTGVQDILEDSQSGIWVGTFGSGLLKITPSLDNGDVNHLNIYDKSHGFPSNNIKTLFEDREGVIWSGNYGEGLTEITPRLFACKTIGYGNSARSIFSVFAAGPNLWLGTDEGLEKAEIRSGKVISSSGPLSGLPKDTVTSVYAGKGGEIYAGTLRNGVFRLAPGSRRFSKITQNRGELENSVTAITGSDKQLWIGTKKGLCNRKISDGSETWYTINAGGLPHNYINGLLADREGALWVTTNSNTLAIIKDGKVSRMTLSQGSGNLVLGPIAEDSDSRIWVGSKGRGVFVVQSDSVINLSSRQGLFSDYCYSIASSNGYIWVAHRGGLSRIRLTDFSVRTFNNFGENGCDYQFNMNAACPDSLQKIWFGTDKGLIAYNPSGNILRPSPPVISLVSLRVNDVRKDISGGRITLSPGKYMLRFDFIGVSMIDPGQVSYQYMLKGYDHWSEITKITSVSYNNVTAGDYSFILKASGADGVATEVPLVFKIIIEQPLWKKWWFYPATIALLILLICLYIKWRLVSLIREKRILETKVLRRTKEIQRQKDEIESQNSLIRNKNASITSSITYASYLQKAVMPPPELIDKLIPENFVLSSPKDIVSGDFYWLAGKDEKIVLVVGDCTGHGVPGAFMSFLGIASLNEIVNIEGITQSDQIVSALRERVVYSLHQDENSITTTDGMEIGLCVIDPVSKTIQYTGARIDLVYFSEGKMNIIRADNFDVSVSFHHTMNFNSKEFSYKTGDVIYLSSDGYQDQFGGDSERKFLRPYFLNLLFDAHKLPMNSQKELLEKKLVGWMRDCAQTDDITVFGVRL
jgi:ligand-binding sensor domain-containing protein/serine phosphatase RsbU (regulator of sigma subunit)